MTHHISNTIAKSLMNYYFIEFLLGFSLCKLKLFFGYSNYFARSQNQSSGSSLARKQTETHNKLDLLNSFKNNPNV